MAENVSTGERPEAGNIASLLALGDVPPPQGPLDLPGIWAVEDWLRDPGGRPVLWVHGPTGSGRTTLVGTAIRRQREAAPRVKRVACFRGVSLEEILDEVSEFLDQTGDRALSSVLDQRVPLMAKVGVLFQVLRRSRIVLWLDDIDDLRDSMAEMGRDPGFLDELLGGFASLDGAAGRLIVVTTHAPPTGNPDGFHRESPDSLPETAVDALWSRAGMPSSSRPPAQWRKDPFTVHFVAKVAARLDGDRRGRLLGSSPDPVPRALEEAVRALSGDAIRLLEAASVLPPAPSRQALRDVAGAGEGNLELHSPEDDPVLAELDGWGLVEKSCGATGGAPILTLPRRVRKFVVESLLENRPDHWRDLQGRVGMYYCRLGRTSGDPWHLYAGWRHLQVASYHEDAYELQKAFVEDILQRGFTEMAGSILEETARTATGPAKVVTLGNLAILYKNGGDFDRAIKTYDQVHDEFVALGDLPNLARVLHQLGNTHYVRGDYEKAFSSYSRSLELSDQLGEKTVAAATRVQIANIHFQIGEEEEALALYVRAIEDTRDLGADALTAAVALQIAQVHFRAGRYLEAEGFLAEAEQTSQSCDDQRNLVKVLQAQGLLARKRREYDVSRERFDAALRTAEELGDAVEAAACLVLTGDLERTRLQLSDALGCYRRARSRLRSFEARGSATGRDLNELLETVDQRIQALAESLGPEAFERVLQRVVLQEQGRASYAG